MVIGYGHLLEDAAGRIGLHEKIGPAPIDGILVVGADPLEVAGIGAFAGGRKKGFGGVGAGQSGENREKEEEFHRGSGESGREREMRSGNVVPALLPRKASDIRGRGGAVTAPNHRR
jgi:hypothetical protein